MRAAVVRVAVDAQWLTSRKSSAPGARPPLPGFEHDGLPANPPANFLRRPDPVPPGEHPEKGPRRLLPSICGGSVRWIHPWLLLLRPLSQVVPGVVPVLPMYALSVEYGSWPSAVASSGCAAGQSLILG